MLLIPCAVFDECINFCIVNIIGRLLFALMNMDDPAAHKRARLPPKAKTSIMPVVFQFGQKRRKMVTD